MEWKGIRGRVLERAPMRRYTSMKVGGPARWLIYPADMKDAVDVIGLLRKEGMPFRFLGRGTNVIVRDEGLNEVLVRMTGMRQVRITKTEDGVMVEAGAGVPLKHLIEETAARGLSGLEKLFGIPGTVGGAVRMNAGSFGVALSDSLCSATLCDAEGKVTKEERGEIPFGYRMSPFGRGDCILSALFRLKHGDQAAMHKDMAYVWGERWRRHPMDLPSAGSVFKNAGGKPAWRSIEAAGLKGLRVGGAAVSEKHANFIVNAGGATARDVYSLIQKVKKEVYEKTGVTLEEEVELWGFDG
jgi:UDP-N-acetylmuramate dehydrogenase